MITTSGARVTPGSLAADAALRVLIIDDSPADAARLRRLLHEVGRGHHIVDWVAEPSAGLVALVERTYDLYLIDCGLDGSSDGLAILAEAVGVGSSAPAILLSSRNRWAVSMAARHVGAACLDKTSLSASELHRAIREVLEPAAVSPGVER